MGFLEKQARTIGFLISVFVEGLLIYILIKGFSKFDLSQWALLTFLLFSVALGIYGQIKFYKVPDYKYTLCSTPGLILAINFAFSSGN